MYYGPWYLRKCFLFCHITYYSDNDGMYDLRCLNMGGNETLLFIFASNSLWTMSTEFGTNADIGQRCTAHNGARSDHMDSR